jgi:hypothetical protein
MINQVKIGQLERPIAAGLGRLVGRADHNHCLAPFRQWRARMTPMTDYPRNPAAGCHNSRFQHIGHLPGSSTGKVLVEISRSVVTGISVNLGGGSSRYR